ncbi:MAG TPA: nucleotidyltransferase family protein [Chthoniobacterales bacterium]
MPESDAESNEFYRRSMELLRAAGVPFLLGGAYAFCVYTRIARHTKDFDLFVRRNDFDSALEVLRENGCRTERTFPHWLGKAFAAGDSIDLIFRAGNGLCAVDDLWFQRAIEAEVLGLRVPLSPPEEMIWMKAYIMERERYDGADVAHLIRHCAVQMDWEHLLRRFGPDWPVLLSHLILFGYIYPAEKSRVPNDILQKLLGRLDEAEDALGDSPLCRGTLLSRAQFLPDITSGGLRDARLDPRTGLTEKEVDSWSAAAEEHVKPHAVAQGN